MNDELKMIVLRKGKEESLLRFHPWIFSGAIHHTEGGTLEEGDIVEVLASDGRFLAIGHWQIGSIAVRVLTFKRQPINQAFWQKRLAAALDVRKAIGVAQMGDVQCPMFNVQCNDIYRLVHGEGDNLPGLVIDIYGATAVMQAHSVGMHVCRSEIAKALKEVMGDSLKAIYYKSETTLPFKAQLGQENGFLYGESSDDVAHENGLAFHIDWLKGQKTGFFVDQRDNRALVEHYAKGRKVLNMFCYTGGFSVYAMRGGAELVHSVDSSAKAVELVDANIELNFPGDRRHESFAEDAFKFMEQASSNTRDGEETVNGKSSNGKWLHGYAVVYGLIAELYLSVVKMGCPKEPLQQLTLLMLHYYGRPQCKCSDREQLIALMQHDKKNERAAEINCTLIQNIGSPVINQVISPDEANEALEYLFAL